MFIESLKHPLGPPQTALAGMVSEASQRWPAASPSYLEQKERKIPVADAGLPTSPTSEEEVRSGRREGNNYCHRLYLFRQVHKPRARKTTS